MSLKERASAHSHIQDFAVEAKSPHCDKQPKAHLLDDSADGGVILAAHSGLVVQLGGAQPSGGVKAAEFPFQPLAGVVILLIVR